VLPLHHDEMPGLYFLQSIFNAEVQRFAEFNFFAVLGILRVSALIRFTTADAYAFTRELEKLHPDN
jgi:hypothetical protein